MPRCSNLSILHTQVCIYCTHALYVLKIPLIYARMRGGSIQEKNGDCILRMWNKGCKDVKEI